MSEDALSLSAPSVSTPSGGGGGGEIPKTRINPEIGEPPQSTSWLRFVCLGVAFGAFCAGIFWYFWQSYAWLAYAAIILFCLPSALLYMKVKRFLFAAEVKRTLNKERKIAKVFLFFSPKSFSFLVLTSILFLSFLQYLMYANFWELLFLIASPLIFLVIRKVFFDKVFADQETGYLAESSCLALVIAFCFSFVLVFFVSPEPMSRPLKGGDYFLSFLSLWFFSFGQFLRSILSASIPDAKILEFIFTFLGLLGFYTYLFAGLIYLDKRVVSQKKILKIFGREIPSDYEVLFAIIVLIVFIGFLGTKKDKEYQTANPIPIAEEINKFLTKITKREALEDLKSQLQEDYQNKEKDLEQKYKDKDTELKSEYQKMMQDGRENLKNERNEIIGEERQKIAKEEEESRQKLEEELKQEREKFDDQLAEEEAEANERLQEIENEIEDIKHEKENLEENFKIKEKQLKEKFDEAQNYYTQELQKLDNDLAIERGIQDGKKRDLEKEFEEFKQDIEKQKTKLNQDYEKQEQQLEQKIEQQKKEWRERLEKLPIKTNDIDALRSFVESDCSSSWGGGDIDSKQCPILKETLEKTKEFLKILENDDVSSDAPKTPSVKTQENK